MPDELEKAKITSEIMRHVEDNLHWVQDYTTGYGQWEVISPMTDTEFADRLRELCDQLSPPAKYEKSEDLEPWRESEE